MATFEVFSLKNPTLRSVGYSLTDWRVGWMKGAVSSARKGHLTDINFQITFCFLFKMEKTSQLVPSALELHKFFLQDD